MADSRLKDLIALAAEPSSERRRELLRGVTDVFFTTQPHDAQQIGLFDDVMDKIAGDMEIAVRAELADRLADAPKPPPRLLRRMATDEIAVSAPVLERSAALTDDMLIEVAQTHGQDHLRAISRRTTVSEAVSDAIVERGDDGTLGVLLTNRGASLSRQANETVVARAAANPALHEAVVNRPNLPPDLLNEMYFVVEARLREQILAKNASIDPAQLDAALAHGRKAVAVQAGVLPPDYDESERIVKRLRLTRSLTSATLAEMLRNGRKTRFLIALADLADVDYHTAQLILDKRELDALAIICKAAGFDRPLFLTLALLVMGRDNQAMGRAKEYGDMYQALPRDTAMRTLRFWRMRRQTGDVVAAA